MTTSAGELGPRVVAKPKARAGNCHGTTEDRVIGVAIGVEFAAVEFVAVLVIESWKIQSDPLQIQFIRTVTITSAVLVHRSTISTHHNFSSCFMILIPSIIVTDSSHINQQLASNQP